ncbi:MAG: hypothetical protein Kow0031_09660 [Anaerolineae bacterium]
MRIKFYNLLPTGMGGDLFIPVDSTVMGSGMTPTSHAMADMNMDPQNPMCSGADKSMMVPDGHCYSDNRATLHLHGGISPWISDGTPHQWITPAGENTPYPQGVSVKPVPDMNDSGNPADGTMTFFYTNQQSARLMFYHDHAWGITRLNVYAGEAAPYIITDSTEATLVNGSSPTRILPSRWWCRIKPQPRGNGYDAHPGRGRSAHTAHAGVGGAQRQRQQSPLHHHF